MITKTFIFFTLTIMAMGFSFASALSLKFKWSWGMAFESDLHVNGLLFGLSFALISFILFVRHISKNTTNVTEE